VDIRQLLASLQLVGAVIGPVCAATIF